MARAKKIQQTTLKSLQGNRSGVTIRNTEIYLKPVHKFSDIPGSGVLIRIYNRRDPMTKKQIGLNTFVFPMPVTLLGTMVNDKPNFMTLGWVSRVNANPPLVGIGVGRHHYTTGGIESSGAFTINYPSVSMVAETDFCGIVSGSKSDKSELFDLFYGERTKAPMITGCTLSVECVVVQRIEFETNNLYIGEIVGVYADEEILDEKGNPDIIKMDPFVLTMPDNRFWSIGNHIGDAWSTGKGLKLG